MCYYLKLRADLNFVKCESQGAFIAFTFSGVVLTALEAAEFPPILPEVSSQENVNVDPKARKRDPDREIFTVCLYDQATRFICCLLTEENY